MAAEVPEDDRQGDPTSQEGESTRPWEVVEPGRYRPLRIRGSLRGRELG